MNHAKNVLQNEVNMLESKMKNLKALIKECEECILNYKGTLEITENKIRELKHVIETGDFK